MWRSRILCEWEPSVVAGGAAGKINPAEIERAVKKRTDIHYPKPRALSISQATEVGTVYSLDELSALTEVAKHFDLRVQMDGARFAMPSSL